MRAEPKPAAGPLFLRRAGRAARLLGLSVLSAAPLAALAKTATGPGLPLLIGQAAGGTAYSVPIQTLLFFTALGFLPAVVLMMTGFTRIVIVLSLLRQALGTQAAPHACWACRCCQSRRWRLWPTPPPHPACRC